MDSTADRELEMIREDAHQTRAKLADKLEALESQVSQTVAGVTSAVEAVSNSVSGVTDVVGQVTEKVTGTVASLSESVAGTVSTVKDTVTGTVNTVAEALDVSSKVQQAPWTSVGCAFVAGLAAGYLTGGRPTYGASTGLTSSLFGGRALGAPPPASAAEATPASHSHSYSHSPAASNGSQAGGQGPTTYDHVGDTLSEIGGSVRSLGVSAIMGLVSHLARQAVPETMKQDVCGALDRLKTRLGGRHDVNVESFLK